MVCKKPHHNQKQCGGEHLSPLLSTRLAEVIVTDGVFSVVYKLLNKEHSGIRPRRAEMQV